MRYLLMFVACAAVFAEPQRPATIEEALASEAIVVAEYLRCPDPGAATYFGGVPVLYRVHQVLQGPTLEGELTVAFAFQDGSACIEPKGWKLDPATLPAAGTRWILFLEHANQPRQPLATYRGGWGRWPLAELVRMFPALPTEQRLGETTATLAPSVWLNLMPGPGPRPKGVRAAIELAWAPRPVDSAPVIDHLWMQRGADVWDQAAKAELGAASRVVVADGPAWNAGDPVTVVARLRGANGRWSLVRGQATITRAD